MPQPSADVSGLLPSDPDGWWRSAVVYQLYIRSFADGNGDGIGDIAGIRSRLSYLSALGVDAIWINPWYPSPQEDAGYDVSDYRAIDPAYGTLDEAEQLIAAAHDAGLRVLLDIVPNHTSDQHPWFQAALAGDPEARSRYLFRPGRGADGGQPPNDWLSNFGGPAWTRTTSADGTPDEWYLHMFAPGQPDLDWSSEEVRAEFEDIIRFWFDRSVDGFRIDVAHGLAKDRDLPDAGERNVSTTFQEPHPAWDQEDVHEIYRSWRKIADSYDIPRIFVGEAWVADNERLTAYLRPDELHSAFQFDFLRSPFRATNFRRVIEEALAAGASVRAPITWVLSNHDVVRQVTRYARSQPEGFAEQDWDRSRWAHEPVDLALGRRRARAAALLMFALPGPVYLYQGEELGLEEVEDIPSDQRQDPTWERSGRTNPGRDGARVPMPWSGQQAPYGFSRAGATATTWLPQPARWGTLTVDAQQQDPTSMLSLYASALRMRRQHLADSTALEWLPAPPETLAFTRGDVQCWVNTGTSDVLLPEGRLLLASAQGPENEVLPGGATAWLVVR